jgi:redox-sensitive bicupin YhaK (pirin superfamily)
MSPSDLGRIVKPFVFLDIFEMDSQTLRAFAMPGAGMPIHPHSGIATVTVITEGWLRFEDPANGSGTIGYGGVEWMRASGGVWHGKEMTAGEGVSHVQGFQLWVALPAELENAEPESRYIEAKDMRSAGPAVVVVGSYEDTSSPVPAPDGYNYLLVTLKAGERWTYTPPPGHTVGWLAVAKGDLHAGEAVDAGEMVLFEQRADPIELQAGVDGSVFVLGSAVPHPYPLHLGMYSVHTSREALASGERRIAELGRKLNEGGDRRTSAGTVPVFR